MGKKWIREYEISFVSPTGKLLVTSVNQIDPLDMAFKIVYEPSNMGQGVMELKVYGLKESNIMFLSQLGVKVWLSVGYKDKPLTLIYTGDIRKAEVHNEIGENYIELLSISSRAGSKPMLLTFSDEGTNVDRVYEMLNATKTAIDDISIEQAVKDIEALVKDAPTAEELEQKLLKNMPKLTDPVDGSYTASDTCMNELNSYLSNFGCEALVHNNEIRVVQKGGNFKQVNAIQASWGENLLKPPRLIVDNLTFAPLSSRATSMYELDMLLEPETLPNSVIVASHRRNDLGVLVPDPIIVKVIKLEHEGRYRGDEWYTKVTGTESASFIVDSPIKTIAHEVANPYKELRDTRAK